MIGPGFLSFYINTVINYASLPMTHFDIVVETRGLQLKLVHLSERIFRDLF